MTEEPAKLPRLTLARQIRDSLVGRHRVRPLRPGRAAGGDAARGDLRHQPGTRTRGAARTGGHAAGGDPAPPRHVRAALRPGDPPRELRRTGGAGGDGHPARPAGRDRTGRGAAGGRGGDAGRRRERRRRGVGAGQRVLPPAHRRGRAATSCSSSPGRACRSRRGRRSRWSPPRSTCTTSSSDHAELLAAIEDGDLETACRHARDHQWHYADLPHDAHGRIRDSAAG